MTNLWILTEERPKNNVIKTILMLFSQEQQVTCFIDNIHILPILDSERRFTFLYEVVGCTSKRINKIYIKIVSGYSSFVDYLVFYQDSQPTKEDIPLYGIEETKTDDRESRNTGVSQRATKFVYIDNIYPDINKVMLYNLRIKQKETATDTYIFGTRCFLTLDVKILGKKIDPTIFKKFETIDEVIDLKKRMQKPPGSNVPITITKQQDKIVVTGLLHKSGSLAHDPNIGTLSMICATLRKLNWEKEIVIANHGLSQSHITPNNKFIKIANTLNVGLEGIVVPKVNQDNKYWKYEQNGEKLGSIFIHLVVENFTEGEAIFENHAGCEKGYFITKDGDSIPLAKYVDRVAYKGGDKSKIIHIPDLILIDFKRTEIINVEGKKYEYREKAIEELKNFDAIEHLLINKYYEDYKIVRTVVLYGGNEKVVYEIEVGFLLNSKGDLILGVKPPGIFKEAVKNLIDYWLE